MLSKRRLATGEQVHHDEDRKSEQAELRHGADQGREHDAQRRHRKKVCGQAEQEEKHRAGHGHAQRAFDHQEKRGHRRRHDHKTVCPDLGEHQLIGMQRHDQQMLQIAVLPLAQHRGAAEENRQNRDIVDDLVDRDEPALLHVGIEARPGFQLRHRRVIALATALPEGIDRAGDDALDVARATAGLAHGGRVGDDFNYGLGVALQVLLEFLRQVHNEGVSPRIHVAIDVTEGYVVRRQEERRQQGVLHRPRGLGVVLIDHGDRSVDQIHDRAFRRRIDRKAEGISDQEQQHRIPRQADQLLDAKPENVQGVLHGQASCFFSKMTDAPKNTTKMIRSATKLGHSATSPSALVKVPTLIAWK